MNIIEGTKLSHARADARHISGHRWKMCCVLRAKLQLAPLTNENYVAYGETLIKGIYRQVGTQGARTRYKDDFRLRYFRLRAPQRRYILLSRIRFRPHSRPAITHS